jgi:hypothetical protein
MKNLPKNNLPTSRLSNLIIEYFINYNDWTKKAFESAQYTYSKDDLNSMQRPSIFVYSIKSDINSFSFSNRGELKFEIRLSLKEQRKELMFDFIQLQNLLELIILQRSMENYCKEFMGGLWWIGKRFNFNGSKINDDADPMLLLTIDYKIDLMIYNSTLQQNGYSLESPDDIIYEHVDKLSIDVELLNDEIDKKEK